MDKIDRQLDQKVSLCLIVIRIVQPIVKIRLVSEPEHCMRAILDPKGLFPLFHDNGAKGNPRQDITRLAYQFCLGQGRSSWRGSASNRLCVGIAGLSSSNKSILARHNRSGSGTVGGCSPIVRRVVNVVVARGIELSIRCGWCRCRSWRWRSSICIVWDGWGSRRWLRRTSG